MNGIIEKEAVITQGEYVTATTHAEEFHLTPGQQYKVLGYNGDILVNYPSPKGNELQRV